MEGRGGRCRLRKIAGVTGCPGRQARQTPHDGYWREGGFAPIKRIYDLVLIGLWNLLDRRGDFREPKMAARVFTIPASAPFLPTLIEASMAASSASPRGIRWLWPRPRSICRRGAPAGGARRFSRGPKGDFAILPRIVALGDIDEDEIAFAEAATGDIAADALALPEAVAGSSGGCSDAAYHPMGHVAGLHGLSGSPLVAEIAGGGLCARRRSGAADRRHDDARRAVGAPRRSGAGGTRQVLAADTEVLAYRHQTMAGSVTRTRVMRQSRGAIF